MLRFVPALAFCVSIFVTSTANAAPGDLLYTHPGQLVSAGDGARLNLYCLGHGSPAVIFDSGFEDWAPAWAVVQPRIARFTRACSYDRAGAGFSTPGPLPRTSVRIAGELRTALRNAGVEGPYILVGSAFGGYNVRTFADLYMDEVAGLVLVDGDATDLEPKDLQDGDHHGFARGVKGLRECRDAVANRKPLPLLPPRPGQPHRTCAQQFYRGLPEAEWSPEVNAKLLDIAQTKVAMYDADISEMEQMPWDETFLASHRRSFGARPIRVLTSGHHGIGHLPPQAALQTPQHDAYEQTINRVQAKWLTLSSNARQIFAPNSSEYIQFDAPEVVVNAVRDVYDASHPTGSRAESDPPASGKEFADCAECPRMTVIPAGAFTMGSPPTEPGHDASEAPAHRVTIPRTFAMDRFDVTREEYAAFAREASFTRKTAAGARAKCDWLNPKVHGRPLAQGGNEPVVCVDWADAQDYAAWLSRKTGRHYFVPSEAQWEYAARAGSTTARPWGSKISHDNANYGADTCCAPVVSGRDRWLYTSPAGSFPPNAFGLADMIGNVWQWTEDCAEDYARTPRDGAPAESGDCTKRIVRGGGWFHGPDAARSASRVADDSGRRAADIGFRVAADIK
jgi:formylglycine-generating enzyme required for sulfatase activity